MSKEKRYIVIREFKSPYTVSTGDYRKPVKLEYKKFKYGDRVSGVPIIKNGDILYVLYSGNIVLPIENLKEDEYNNGFGEFDGLSGFDGLEDDGISEELDYFKIPFPKKNDPYVLQYANSTTNSISVSIFGN